MRNMDTATPRSVQCHDNQPIAPGAGKPGHIAIGSALLPVGYFGKPDYRCAREAVEHENR